MINLGLDQEERVLRAAARQGIDAGEYVRRLIELYATPESTVPSLNETYTPEARAGAYRAWAEGHHCATPLLSDEAISRESMYSERG